MHRIDGKGSHAQEARRQSPRAHCARLVAALLSLFALCCLIGPVASASAGASGSSAQVLPAWVALQQAELNASDGKPVDVFGYSVAVSGDTALVGARWNDPDDKTDAGAAYVFVRVGATWTMQQKLTAADGAAHDVFGSSAAVSGDIALVGAAGHDTSGKLDAGAAYVFVRSGTTWVQQAKLTAADGASADAFGHSVAVDGETALVGAPYHGVSGSPQAGAAYVFVRSGGSWSQQQELNASDGFTNDYLGWSVALSGDTALAGAVFHDLPGADNAGAAFVFVRSGTHWTQQQELTAAGGVALDYFGISVAISGETALIGAVLKDTGTVVDAGAAYVFVRSGATWSQQQMLTAGADAAAEDYFGISVAISGETALVGAVLKDAGGKVNSGAAYIFVRSGATWGQQQTLTAADSSAHDWFGDKVALSGDTALIGAYSHSTTAGVDAGAAYVFVFDAFAPTTTATGADNLWHNAAVTVTFNAADNPGGSGMSGGSAKTEYKLDSGAWTGGTICTVPAPADHSGDGAHTVTYRSTDAAGNVEADKTLTVKIDTGAPSGVMAINGGAAYTTTTAAAADSSVTDAVGVTDMRFSLDNKTSWGAWLPYAATVPLTLPAGDGTKTAWAQYRDPAGNLCEISDAITLDALAPTTVASGVPVDWSITPVTVTLTATDAVSGVALTEYRQVGAAVWTPYSGPVVVDAPGTSAYEYRSVDAAGNVETTQTFTVRITPKPAIVGLSPKAAKRGATVTITGTGFGALRGISVVKFGTKMCTKYLSWSDTQIRCRVPTKAKIGTVAVTVTTLAGTSDGKSFRVKS